MKFRTKVMLLFVGVAVCGLSLSAGISERQRRNLLFEQRRSKLLTLTATTATLLPADLISNIASRDNEKTPAFQQLLQTLRRVRTANRREDFIVSSLYILRPVPEKPGQFAFVADAEESPQSEARPGDIYRCAQGTAPIDASRLQADDRFQTDMRGTWLRAFAPIRDARGQVVATVAGTLSRRYVEARIEAALLLGLIGPCVALLLIVSSVLAISTWVSRPLRRLTGTVHALTGGDLAARSDWKASDEFGDLSRCLDGMAAGLQERDRIKTAFARYVSQSVIERTLGAEGDSLLKGDRRQITVLFADIRNFTTLCEDRRAEEIVALLSAYFERMIGVVMAHHGWVDKFLGDGLMVTFGALEDDPHHQKNAIRAALEMQAQLRLLCAEWGERGWPPLRIGIGIHSGYAIVGNIGSSERLEFTALGDAVNLASRLQSATKEVGVDILISEYTLDAVRGLFQTVSCGTIKVKGRTAEVPVYAVEAERPASRVVEKTAA